MSSPASGLVMPDVELMVILLLRQIDPAWKVRTDTDDLTMLTVQVTRIGGGPVLSGRVDRARLDLDVYAPNRNRALASVTARTIAANVPTWRNAMVEGSRISESRVESGPAIRPYSNDNLRRVGMTVVVAVRP